MTIVVSSPPPVTNPETSEDSTKLLRALDLLIRHLELQHSPDVTPITGQFGPVPLSCSMLAYGLSRSVEALGGASGRSLLDVGAGIGTKLLLASYLFPNLRCEGIEIQCSLVEVAQKLGANVHVADAMEWEKFGEFDIVFAYRPCCDIDMEKKLEARLFDLMSPGAILFLVMGVTDPPWEEISGCVWRKPN